MVAEHVQVVGRQVAAGAPRRRLDLVALRRRGQPHAGVQALLDRGVAADPAEDEHDGRQQALAVEPVDDVDAAGDPHPAAVADLAGPPPPRPLPRPCGVRRSLIRVAGPVVAGDLHQLVVDRGALLDEAGGGVDVGGGEEVEQAACRPSRAGRAARAGAPPRSWWSRRARWPATRRTPRRWRPWPTARPASPTRAGG